MPRKVDYGIDYDDYEGYDYDYDDEEEVEQNAKTMPTKEASKTVVWGCPICTNDNEDSMSACDICGVLRNPLGKTNIRTDNVAALFKFNGPSPDDLVSSGLQTLKMKSKAAHHCLRLLSQSGLLFLGSSGSLDPQCHCGLSLSAIGVIHCYNYYISYSMETVVQHLCQALSWSHYEATRLS